MNKAVQGQFPPGSIFKLVLAAGALDMGLITPDTTFVCKGKFRLRKEVRYCWKRSGHGKLNLAQAIEKSCNVYFYQTGLLMGVDNIAKYARMFGFGSRTGVEVESEKVGLIPTRQWKLQTLGEKWYDGETLPVSIGQGFVSVTPIQMAAYVNTIANGGVWVRPTLFKKEDTGAPAAQWELPKDSRTLPINPAFFEVIRKGMIAAVHSRQGTAQRARSRRFTVAGKTGTSQLVSRKTNAPLSDSDELDESLLPHSIFIGFAPAEAPKLSVVVLVEHGKSGGRVAAPIGRKILEFYSKTIERLDPPMRKPRTLDAETARFRRELKQAFGESRFSRPAAKGKRR
jgi:penicillin-binding protein 2